MEPRSSNAEPAGRVPPRRSAVQQPVLLLYGLGNRIVHANPAFVEEFGAGLIGLPATEALPEWPKRVFDVIARVQDGGRPLATWVEIGGRRRRLTVAPRRDPEDGEIYGVAVRVAIG